TPLPIDHFLRKYWRRAPPSPRFTMEAQRVLAAHTYPGNVRELGHVVERACLLATGPELGLDLLPPELAASPLAGPSFASLSGNALNAAREAALTAVERAFLSEVMTRSGGNVSLAARNTGMRRSYLQKLLAKHR